MSTAAIVGEYFPVRMVGLNALTIDPGLESRCEMSVEHARGITEFVLSHGPISEPIVVFDDRKELWVADGFHRARGYAEAARVDRRFRQIRAEIRPGSREDAIVFSAGANQTRTYLPRTSADIARSVRMLLDLGWLNRQAKAIARHVGVSTTTVNKYRAEYCHERGIDLRGYPRPEPAGDHPEIVTRVPSDGRSPFFEAKIGQKTIRLGVTKKGIERAAQKLNRLAGREQSKGDRAPRFTDDLRTMLLSRGIYARTCDRDKLGRVPSLHGLQCGRFIVTYCEHGPGSLGLSPIGRVLCVRQLIDPRARAVILTFGTARPEVIRKAAEALGVEFMSLDEFVSAVGPAAH